MLTFSAGVLLLLLIFAAVEAAPTSQPEAIRNIQPRVKHAIYLANVTDPALSRDSCGSTRVGERAFWTCRDTSRYDVYTGKTSLPIVTNSASWTGRGARGHLDIAREATTSGSKSILRMYGGNDTDLSPYFPVLADECPSEGVCNDGTRWAVWPDQPPVMTGIDKSGNAVGYTWIRKAHLQGLTALDTNPAYTLYKTSYTFNDDPNILPVASVVDGEFWKPGEIGYGQYGSVMTDGTLYLYGQTNSKQTALARVPVGRVEDRTAYQYFCSGTWTNDMPSAADLTTVIPNAGAGGQGTFYHSAYFNRYVWIGQQALSSTADFYITTAPTPEGPWTKPEKLWSGQNGNGDVAGGYSLQAHPGLLASGHAREGGIFLTWTQQWKQETVGRVYVTPLVWVEFE